MLTIHILYSYILGPLAHWSVCKFCHRLANTANNTNATRHLTTNHQRQIKTLQNPRGKKY